MNPAVTGSFALAIAAETQGPAYPGVAGHEPDGALGRLRAKELAAAMAPLKAFETRPSKAPQRSATGAAKVALI